MWVVFFSEARAILKENEQHLQASNHFAFLFFYRNTISGSEQHLCVHSIVYRINDHTCDVALKLHSW